MSFQELPAGVRPPFAFRKGAHVPSACRVYFSEEEMDLRATGNRGKEMLFPNNCPDLWSKLVEVGEYQVAWTQRIRPRRVARGHLTHVIDHVRVPDEVIAMIVYVKCCIVHYCRRNDSKTEHREEFGKLEGQIERQPGQRQCNHGLQCPSHLCCSGYLGSSSRHQLFITCS